jgi:hypothetical protein
MTRYAFAIIVVLVTGSLQATESDRYLPADTEFILRLNIGQMLEAPALKNDKEALQKAKKIVHKRLADYDAALKRLVSAEVDFYRDISTLTAALPGDADPEKIFVLMDGKFDAEKFQAAAKKPTSGLKVIKLSGREVYEFALPGLDQPIFACLLDESTLAATSRKAKLADALAKAKEKAEPAKKVQPLVALLDGKHHLSFAGTRAVMVKLLAQLQLPFGDALPVILEDADTIHGGLTIGKEVDLTLRFQTRDEKTARQFLQQMTIVVAVARGAIAKEAKEDKRYLPLVELMKTLRTGVEGTAVAWRAQMKLDSAASLLENLGK